MPINRERVRQYLQKFNFRDLFVEELNWSGGGNAKPTPMAVTAGDETATFNRRQIAQLSGITVFEITPSGSSEQRIPNAKLRLAVYNQTEPIARENLLIFLDRDSPRTQAMWYWVKRDGAKKHPREHLYVLGQPGDLFISKIDGLMVELDELREKGAPSIVEATRRMASALDIERITKQFYGQFSELRLQFIEKIQGIDKEADRNWYASVLLNRLLFVYFLQKQQFVQGNTHYLEDKLKASQTRGADRFYREFLQMLFFEGFAKPKDKRSAQARELLGDIRYLNGGLFLQHRLEQQYPAIAIPDAAFSSLFALLGRYSWHLDDTPGASDNEINPDVLGYIFEKYINQKAFGAYYTRTEITTYLCERTIHAAVLDKLNAQTTRQYKTLEEVLTRLDADLCRKLLAILPSISVLDPACGSGAFLVAAMKTLLNIYAAALGKIEFLNDTNLTNHLNAIRRDHPSLNYYMRKKIITDNLYGVDIMEEATEIARLRLFLTLVGSVNKVDDLEPLPNIDFNIMAGNSLIGVLHVDESRFDKATTSSLKQLGFAETTGAAIYHRLLDEKNVQVANYRAASSLTDDVQALREKIEQHRVRAYTDLNAILLDDFQALGIKYEQAQPDGKAKKRSLAITDIQVLEPFHWGYEFSEIISTRGGFDVIITNPPWEIFKPQAKEFFADYSDIVSKNKMDIKAFETEQAKLLENSEVGAAWLEYQNRFPYVSAYYRAAAQYVNQISIVNGKKAGTDVNLYKLFTEQCFNLLRPGGECGIVIPSGIYTDLGAKKLREMLFNRTTITGLFGFENRKMIFEGVDSRFKFVVLTFAKDGSTLQFSAVFMRHNVTDLEQFPSAMGLTIQIDLVRRLSPDSLSIMEFSSDADVQIAEKMLHFPLLGEDVSGRWKISFGYDLHMTQHSRFFSNERKSDMLPVYEGKMIHQFTHLWEGGSPRYWVDQKEGRKAIIGKKGKDTGQKLDYEGYRLGFRDVAASTNERTVISTIIPPGVFDGNTLIVTSEPTEPSCLLGVASLFNSFVVDWIIRQKVTSHLSMFYVYQTPLPRLMSGDPYFEALVSRSARLICTTPEFDDLAKEVGLGSYKNGVTDEAGRAKLRAEIDGMVAHVYGLTAAEFAHILSTFPIVAESIKVAALNAYRDVGRGLIK